MALNMMPNNEKIKDMWDGVMIFVHELATFQAIIDDYDATDFCQGVQFGIHGSRVVIAAGKHMVRDI